MNEKIVRFGKTDSLCGVVSMPAVAAEGQHSKPAIMIINAGSVHKVGPFRLHVELARWLASKGYVCFRFDLSGQGESQIESAGGSRADQVLEDMRSALDYMQESCNQQQVVAFGLCTGADNAHKIAIDDPRIAGVVWLDGYGYTTPKFNTNRLLAKLGSPVNQCRALLKRLPALIGQANNSPLGVSVDESDQFFWELPAIENYRADMSLLFARAVNCLYIYSGGVQSYYNYQGQMKDAFKGEQFVALIREIYFPKADHTFFIRKDRRIMFEKLTEWLEDSF